MAQPLFEMQPPSDQEAEVARESSRVLSTVPTKKSKIIELSIKSDQETKFVKIPLSAFKLLINILTEMSEGNAITLIPTHAEITTQQAADLLNVSRPFLIRLLDQKILPFRKVGTRRRILISDLIKYKNQIDADRRRVLDELVEEAQNLDMGY